MAHVTRLVIKFFKFLPFWGAFYTFLFLVCRRKSVDEPPSLAVYGVIRYILIPDNVIKRTRVFMVGNMASLVCEARAGMKIPGELEG